MIELTKRAKFKEVEAIYTGKVYALLLPTLSNQSLSSSKVVRSSLCWLFAQGGTSGGDWLRFRIGEDRIGVDFPTGALTVGEVALS